MCCFSNCCLELHNNDESFVKITLKCLVVVGVNALRYDFDLLLFHSDDVH